MYLSVSFPDENATIQDAPTTSDQRMCNSAVRVVLRTEVASCRQYTGKKILTNLFIYFIESIYLLGINVYQILYFNIGTVEGNQKGNALCYLCLPSRLCNFMKF